MNVLLLGGWLHVADDVRRLAAGLKVLPDACTCGHGSSHLAGMCPCCRDGQRTLGNGCTDCEALLASIREGIDELVDATLRFHPFVETSTEGSNASESVSALDLRRQILNLDATFRKVETAADEFRKGCCASHVGVLKTLADELAAVTRELDAKLRPTPAHAERAPWLR